MSLNACSGAPGSGSSTIDRAVRRFMAIISVAPFPAARPMCARAAELAGPHCFGAGIAHRIHRATSRAARSRRRSCAPSILLRAGLLPAQRDRCRHRDRCFGIELRQIADSVLRRCRLPCVARLVRARCGRLCDDDVLRSSSYPYNVTADEIAFELMGSMHGHEAAGRGIDDDVSGLRGRRDQTFDESDWLNVRMNSAVDLLWPAVGDPVITPGARVDWRLLQHDEIVTASARALAHAGAQVVPRDEINGLKIGNAEMMTLTKTVGIDPAHQIPAGRKHSHELDANRINIFFGHRR